MIVNHFHIQRGALCVIRAHCIDGRIQPVAFQIKEQAQWREWSGAFSML